MGSWDRAWRWILPLPIAEGALILATALGQTGLFNVRYGWAIVGDLVKGFFGTAALVSAVIPVGFLLGFFVGWGRTSPSWFTRTAATAYVEFFRGMPPLVLIVFGSLSATLVLRRYLYVEDPFLASLAVGVLALGFHSGGYQAEIIRAGILSVPRGQLEAAYAMGLTPWQTLISVIIPQAFRVSLPALGNEFSSAIKDTSLLSAISAFELSYVAGLVARDALDINLVLVLVPWVEAAILYFVLTFVVVQVVQAIERRVRVPGLEAPRL